MSDHTSDEGGPEASRRDFLYLSTGAFAAIGAATAIWPFLHSMNPSADVLALAQTDVDLSPIEVGQRLTIAWRNKPVFIARRTEAEIARARADNGADLIDPATDAERAQRAEWLIVIGICTHLGCVPLGQDPGSPRGKYDGWFCPCHGSLYDTAGRVRRGPAPRNLDLPDYAFVDDSTVLIG